MPGWVQLAVETSIPWPEVPRTIQYAGREIELTPSTESTYATIAVRLQEHETAARAQEFLQRFLSALSWIERMPARVVHATRGGMKIRFGLDSHRGVIGGFSLQHAPTGLGPDQRLALALYREGLSLCSASYAFLSYYKVVNLLHPEGKKKQIAWIAANLQDIESIETQPRLHALRASGTDVAMYLYESCRCAVAHAGVSPVIDPDDPRDESRLRDDLPVIKALAERLIETELGVKSRRTIFREHLYELDGFRRRLGAAVLAKLKAGEQVPPKDIPSLPSISIGLAGHAKFEVFSDLTPRSTLAPPGVVLLTCAAADGSHLVPLSLDFARERLEFHPLSVEISDDGTARSVRLAASALLFWRELLLNGAVEVREAVTGDVLGRCDAYIPMNIDVRATVANVDAEISAFEALRRVRSGVSDPSKGREARAGEGEGGGSEGSRPSTDPL